MVSLKVGRFQALGTVSVLEQVLVTALDELLHQLPHQFLLLRA